MTMTRTGAKVYPALNFRFHVDIGGDQAAFAECSGLEIETEVFEYQEGGRNDYVHRLPGRTKHTDITLKRGITKDARQLWNWYAKTLKGEVERRTISIFLLGQDGTTVMQWEAADAYPVKWSGPTVKADDHQVAIEQLKLAHRGLSVK